MASPPSPIRATPVLDKDARLLADQAFSRAAGAPLVAGNAVRLLCDAGENYPAWLAAIERAERHVHFETYILHEDAVGERFFSAFAAKAPGSPCASSTTGWAGSAAPRAASGGGWPKRASRCAATTRRGSTSRSAG